MPITKVPIVHRFGIISQTQRLELQERLLKKAFSEESKKDTLQRNPFEVTEEFIQNYNEAEENEEQEKLKATAYKMLERIKRRAGLRDAGKGSHVDLPLAWTELAQLSQCTGKIQEDCLDALITSLEQSPIQANHIPALFYLAETTLYWLRTDAMHQPYLRAAEVKLLHMGKLVFNRLFYHHMTGHLKGHEEFKSRLSTYLNGFREGQEVYSPYPNALLCIRYISEVGNMVLDTDQQGRTSTTDTPTNDQATFSPSPKPTVTSRSYGTDQIQSSRQSVIEAVSPSKSNNTDGQKSPESALSSSVHDLSPTLWHALDVWRCLQQNSAALPEALSSLKKCAQNLATESWTDCICALHILGDAGKRNQAVLNALLSLAMGNNANMAEHTKSLAGQTPFYNAKICTESHASKQPNKAKEAKFTENQDDQASVASSTITYANEVFPETPGLHGWSWEVAVVYTDILTDVCLHGSTSNIQKTALAGNNLDLSLIYQQSSPQCPMRSAALLDLIYFKGLQERNDGGADDWSWRVRYTAMQGLVKLCKCTVEDSTKEGLRSVAWNNLQKVQSLERDTRVLEALKVGQVESNIENLLNSHMQDIPSTIGAKVAAGLSALYLPNSPRLTAQKPKPQVLKKTTVTHATTSKPQRTSLREEITIANALYEPPITYETRTGFDLSRIVEDQWRKDLQQQLEEEEEEQQKELEEKQKAEEKAEMEREEARKMKLGSKYKGPAYTC